VATELTGSADELDGADSEGEAGLESAMSPQDLADLLAFLKGEK